MPKYRFVFDQTVMYESYVNAPSLDQAYDSFYDGQRTDPVELKFCDENILVAEFDSAEEDEA